MHLGDSISILPRVNLAVKVVPVEDGDPLFGGDGNQQYPDEDAAPKESERLLPEVSVHEASQKVVDRSMASSEIASIDHGAAGV